MTENIPRKAPNSGSKVGPNPVSLRCPDCGRYGTFEPVESLEDYLQSIQQTEQVGPQSTRSYFEYWRWGQRRCPFPECHAHVFVVLQDDTVITSYPPETIDFNREGIPTNITNTLEEAITCHANRCYVASAIMVRRTLEEICEDREAKGANLWQRIGKLKERVVISEGLIEGMGNLIMLGNDAAHVESRTFEQVSKEEVGLGIEIAKEILKAVYQEKTLVERLNSLKKRTP